ncbi:methyl-accepting chemotaxis protein, partial [Pseudomonas sp. GW6]
MGAWISDLSLKYKFWAVNAVAFVISLMLVLFALHTEQQARSADARQAAIEQARLLQQWPQQA